MELRLYSRSPWFWCSCVCARICRYGLVCAFTLRGPGARVFVCRYADMGYVCFRSPWFWCSCVCVRIRRYGQGLRSRSPCSVVVFIAVFGCGDVGKDCALALLGLVLVFIAVFGHGDVGKD